MDYSVNLEVASATSTWIPVARKEYAQAIRWRGLWFLTLLALGFTYYGGGISGGLRNPRQELVSVVGPDSVLAALQMPVGMVMSLAALLVAYQSLIGPPSDGSLRLIAAQPHSRATIVTGTVLGRAAAVGTSVVLLFVVAGVMNIWLHGLFNPITYLLGLGIALLYVLVITALSTSISIVVQSRATAAVLTSAYYLLLILLWESVVSTSLYTAFFGSYRLSPPPSSRILYLLKRTSPIDAFDVLVNTLLGLENAASAATITVLNSRGDPFTVLAVSDAFQKTPVLLTPTVSLFILIAWGAVPLVLGYHHFSRQDLN